jgi:hypothetical protein
MRKCKSECTGAAIPREGLRKKIFVKMEIAGCKLYTPSEREFVVI